MGYCITLSTCCGVEPPCTHGTAQILPAATKLNSETQAPFCGHSRSTGLCKSFAATTELREKKKITLFETQARSLKTSRIHPNFK